VTNIIQNIRRKCSPDLFEAVSSGNRSFDVRIDSEDIQVDDWYTFVDQDNEKNVVPRKVSYVVRTGEWDDETKAEAEKHGVVIVGLLPVEHGTLESFFVDNHVVISMAVDKRDGHTEIEEAVSLPAYVAPPVDSHSLADALNVPLWPPGVYTIMVRAEVGEGDNIDLPPMTVKEHIVMVMEKEGEQFARVDENYLRVGMLKNLAGEAVEAFLEVEGHDEEEFDEEERQEIIEKILAGEYEEEENGEMDERPDPSDVD